MPPVIRARVLRFGYLFIDSVAGVFFFSWPNHVGKGMFQISNPTKTPFALSFSLDFLTFPLRFSMYFFRFLFAEIMV